MIHSRLMLPPNAEIDPDERLSDALNRLLREAKGQAMSMREMIEILQGRGMQMIIILLCLPFLSPVTIPGISLPFGLAIAVCGLRMGFGHQPWLPQKLLNRKISHSALEKMVRAGCRIYGWVEKIVRPRCSVLLVGPGMPMLIGLALAVSGLILALPIPPPFILTNTIPGFAIVFLALGWMERDGILVLIGHALTGIAIVYIALIALLGRGIYQLLASG